MADPTHIVVRNARTHNLRGIDVDVPRHALVVFTGVSGSGKSSLVFDTIHLEGQRRFMESLSSYARQFLGQMERPEVDSVEGVSPTVSIDQKTVNRNPRSTVGTTTEIFDHLRLLWARLGTPHCPICDTPVSRLGAGQIVDEIMTRGAGHRVSILAPVVRERKGEYRKEMTDLARDGWVRARVDGEMIRLDEPPELDRYKKHTIEVVVDRLTPTAADRGRLAEAVETALRMGERAVTVLTDEEDARTYGTERACVNHPEQTIPELEPRLFSFNSPQGACPTCDGLGLLAAFEPDRMVDSRKPIRDAVLVFNADGKIPFGSLTVDTLVAIAKALGADLKAPVSSWTAAQRHKLLHGDENILWRSETRDGRQRQREWAGLIPMMDQIWHYTKFPGLEKYRTEAPCPDCHGARLSPIARAVRFRGLAIHEVSGMTVRDAHALFEGIGLEGDERLIGALLLQEIRARLTFLSEVGLDYLSLSRSAATLSGGESQRIRLASQVGSGLQGVTYVLDEPSIGLHPRDNQRLLHAIRRLRDRGNSVLVVEHDAETILAADWVVDIGPGAGREGGHLVASGPPSRVMRGPGLTAEYLRGERFIALRAERRVSDGRELVVRGARIHNLKDVTLRLPLGIMSVITGVSGSGKSSLAFGVLEPSLVSMLEGGTPIDCDAVEGVEHLGSLVRINQRPIGRTPRSNPATYTGAMDLIRDLFAATQEARVRGYTKSQFSFNVPGGRCESCEGAGVRTIEMQFLPDVEVPCETCGGRRFSREILDITWKGRSVTEILELTIGEALEVFAGVPKLKRILQTLVDVGLDYVALGQSSTTLSGGEAQRIKLASELHKPSRGHTLYLLDEPTTGLHWQDVDRLLHALDRLVDAGNTVVIVEHHTDVIKRADWIVDLGPEGGDAGGRILAEGTPEQIARQDSATGHALAALPELGGVAPIVADAPLVYDGAREGTPTAIVLEGARQHNLQSVDVRIPHGKLTVITGPSGSGKTSLAFDTIFAEGQRRYVESLSTYARRFLGRLDRAALDRIEGLQPAIAIDQKSASHNPRSTVATVTEIHDVLRILYARIGVPHCHLCDRALLASSPGQVASRLANARPGAGWLAARLVPDEDPDERLGLLVRDGWQRLLLAGKGGTFTELQLDDKKAKKELSKGALLVLDRFDPATSELTRVAEAARTAYHLGHGHVQFVPRAGGDVLRFTEGLVCPTHGPVLPELTPRHFSFNSRLGMCGICDGLGVVERLVLKTPTIVTCPRCDGARLKPEVLAVTLGGRNIHELSTLTVDEAHLEVDGWDLHGEAATIAARPRQELARRLRFLIDVGLGYLSLDRAADSLSGGESQRIRLASQLGSQLTGVTYVLDEPTVGLHPRDTDRLLKSLEGLRDLGNTVVVVEHDPETIARADHVIDLGPEAGRHGGNVVAFGTPYEIMQNPASVTGPWLSGAAFIPTPNTRRKGDGGVTLIKPRLHNLSMDKVRFPLGAWTAVTGVSGSGKSSLVMDTLAPALRESLGQDVEVGEHKDLFIEGSFDGVVIVDQRPIGVSPRSTPATYGGTMDKIRALFAESLGARERGWTASRFSFNAQGGRCSHCEGRGAILIEMHFLPDVWVECPECHGRRFDRETLAVRWGGHSIADVLNMRADEARDLFVAHRALKRSLDALCDVGLGYLTLGQPATTLSGGEAQRVKLATELIARSGKKVYVLDEPTTGLHLNDVAKLVGVLHRLVDAGHTVITIEHNLDVILQADLVIELGPEGGAGGGKLLAQGTPAQIQSKKTATGLALAARAERLSETRS